MLVVLGVITLYVNFAFSGADDVRQRQQASAQAEAAREAIRYFVLANKRLPCPGDDDGYEDCTAGETGHLPYLNLGLADDSVNRITYGVYRATGDDDVTRLEERTGDAEGQPDYLGYGDTISALRRIPEMPVASHIHVAAVNADGTSDCNQGLSQPVFILVVPNRDKDSDNNLLDGVNAEANNCFASPLQASASNYDDVVVTESSTTLIGWLARHLN
ncbi:MAG: hypothetical protein LBU46_07745 [Candidatus Accumulibacter sp.]|nr:hypothetical protein [Accumulibacter sp.]